MSANGKIPWERVAPLPMAKIIEALANERGPDVEKAKIRSTSGSSRTT